MAAQSASVVFGTGAVVSEDAFSVDSERAVAGAGLVEGGGAANLEAICFAFAFC